MREFGAKYDGNIQAALRGFQKERLAAEGADATLGEIDKSMRKRKWVASQESEPEASGSSQPKDGDSQRGIKNGAFTLFEIQGFPTHIVQLEHNFHHPRNSLDLQQAQGLRNAPDY